MIVKGGICQIWQWMKIVKKWWRNKWIIPKFEENGIGLFQSELFAFIPYRVVVGFWNFGWGYKNIRIPTRATNSGGILKICPWVPKLWIWLVRGWGRCLKVTLQTGVRTNFCSCRWAAEQLLTLDWNNDGNIYPRFLQITHFGTQFLRVLQVD